jgi:hypothetical protein
MIYSDEINQIKSHHLGANRIFNSKHGLIFIGKILCSAERKEITYFVDFLPKLEMRSQINSGVRLDCY